MTRSYIGRLFVKLLYWIGAVRLYNHFSYYYDKRHPSKEMNDSIAFFSSPNQKKRIDYAISCLADRISIETLIGCIKYRCSHDYKDRPPYSAKDQYFPQDIVKLGTEEVFVDCGAYDGETIRAFKKKVNNQYKKIIAFEPDNCNMKMLKKRNPDVICYTAATWNVSTKLSFRSGNGNASHVDKAKCEGGLVDAYALDDLHECHEATFIKMDVEGSECNTLIGAKRIITSMRPKLAVCIYHSDDDMLRIIELLSSWKLNYKFYVRHHAQKIFETVLYAIPND